MAEQKLSKIFPDGFLWGAATAAHQVEGNNRNQWTRWELANAADLAFNAKDSTVLKNKKALRAEAFEPSNYISA